MKEITRKVQHQGRQSRVVALPRPILNQLGIKEGDSIKYIILEDGSIRIEKVVE